MRRYQRWFLRGLSFLVVLVLIFSAFVYATSSVQLRRTHKARAHPLSVPTDAAAIAEGGRLARIRGCYGACHGENAGGQVLDEPFLAGGAIPDLTRIVRAYSDAELERAIRHGVKPDGRRVIEFMPSGMYNRLSDQDLGAIIAFLRSLPPAHGPSSSPRFRYLARTMMTFGRIGFAVDEIDPAARHGAPDRANPVAFGEYLVLSSCTECHVAELSRDSRSFVGNAPDLRIIGTYSPEQFTRLLREGVPRDGRELGLMKSVAQNRFTHFTDEEIAAIYAYGSARAKSVPADRS